MAVEVIMYQLLCRLWREDEGQDLIEYSLLITFVALATAVMVGSSQSAIKGIWTNSSSTLVLANSSTS
jgi:Flp pilus assembly pilin Flp